VCQRNIISARGPQLVNRAVDIGPTIETKLACLRSCRTMMIHMIKDLNASLVDRSCGCRRCLAPKTPLLTSSQKMALENQRSCRRQEVRLDYAEEFHYIGPDHSLDDYS